MLETLPEQQNVSGSIARKASNTVFKRTSRSQLAVCRIQLCLCSVMSCVHAHSSLLLMSRICSRPAPVRKWRTYRTVTACKTSSADAAEKYDWKLDRKPNPHTRGEHAICCAGLAWLELTLTLRYSATCYCTLSKVICWKFPLLLFGGLLAGLEATV